MSVAASKPTPFERVLFVLAVCIGLIAFALRFGTGALLWLSHHVR
jgi:hypothetical protein